MTEPTISLSLTASQVNAVLMALNEAPYKVAAPLIAAIIGQASAEQGSVANDPDPKARPDTVPAKPLNMGPVSAS